MGLPRRHPISPYRLYLVLESGMSFLLGITYATITVYWVTSGRLNPLQLLLLGTALEVSYFLLQLPTGVLADMVSRRLCVLAGLFIVGLALVMEGLSPSFANLLGAQVVLGLGAALSDGAQEAWIADELGDDQMTGVYLRATQFGLIATIAGSLLSGVIALAGLNAPLAHRRQPHLPARRRGRLRDARAQLPPAASEPARDRLGRQAGERHARRPGPLDPAGDRRGAGPGAAVRDDAVRRAVERELRPALGRVPAAGHQVPATGGPAPGDVVQPVRLRGRGARARLDRGRQAPHRAARS